MKRLKYYIASLLVLPCLISCNDFLERYPLDAMNDQSFFTSETDLEYYMNSLYNSHIIRNTIQQRWQNFTSGDDDVVFNSPNSFLMQHSSSGQADETSSTWNGAYDYLRSVNYFIANAPRVGAMTAIGKHY